MDITFKRADNGEYTEQTVQITLSDQSAVQQDSGSQNNGMLADRENNGGSPEKELQE